MTFYVLILTIHLIAAVVGLGAAFALPIVMKLPKTVSEVKFAFQINKGVEKSAKIGSITLLVTGLIMGFLSPSLFKEIWFIASIVIYIGIQFIVTGIIPRTMQKQMEILEGAKDEVIPDEYMKLAKAMAPYHTITNLSAILLIILMTLKPF